MAIAGVLAMQPEVLVLDEATAMLDPLGRSEVLEVARRLNREQGVTIVAVTHFMREAIEADRLVIMADGQIALEGPPRELFQRVDELRSLHLDVPHISELALALHERDPEFPPDVLTVPEIVAAISQRARPRSDLAAPGGGRFAPGRSEFLRSARRHVTAADTRTATGRSRAADVAPLLSLQHVAHYYMRGTPLQVQALSDINIEIYPGEIVGILGHTGSGKSTAIQHFNALLRPARRAGDRVGPGSVEATKTDVRAIRRQVGLVFQLPEAQLFEQYVGDDVAYGPRRLGLSREEVRARVRRAMEAVGLGFAEFKDRITFSLSGGQMRRVALAGVLALEPRGPGAGRADGRAGPAGAAPAHGAHPGPAPPGHHAGDDLAQHGGAGRDLRPALRDRRRAHGHGGYARRDLQPAGATARAGAGRAGRDCRWPMP